MRVVMQLRNLIASMAALCDLAFFSCECRAVKFYGLSNAGELFGSQVTFRRNPDHCKDPNCVEVVVAKHKQQRQQSGSLQCFLDPLILKGEFNLYQCAL